MMNDIIADNPFLVDIVQSSPASIAVISKDDLAIAYCNDQFTRNIFNGAADGTELRTFKNMLDADQQERLRAQLQESSDHASARDKYMVYRLHIHGQMMQVYIYASPLRPLEPGGKYYQLFLLPDFSKGGLPFISFDTRELFFRQFRNVDFGTFEWLIAQDKVFWTDGIYNIYDMDRQRENFSLSAIDKYTHPDDKEIVDKVMSAAFRDRQDIDVEYRIITEKNKVKNIHALGRITYSSDGKREKLIGSIKDITSQRKNEEDLLNSVKVLNKSNKDLEEFAYVASHDLQEPLRKISTFSDRLNEKYKNVLTGDGIMYLERMMASAENMRTLINNLLEFSRITKSVVPFTHISLNFVLQQVKTDLELKIEETGTIINSVQLPSISASMTQMKQLFENIINNAIKFRKQDSTPVINIECTLLPGSDAAYFKLSDKQTYYKIQITDNGIGFEEEYALRIFKIFQRLHGKAEYPGSGIGLAICQKILEHHNGIIYAENIPAAGARFTFILPEHQPENPNKS